MENNNFQPKFEKAYKEINDSELFVSKEVNFLWSFIDISTSKQIDLQISELTHFEPWIKFERANNNTFNLPKKEGYYLYNLFDEDSICQRIHCQVRAISRFITDYWVEEDIIYVSIPVNNAYNDIIKNFCKCNPSLSWSFPINAYGKSNINCQQYYTFKLYIFI